MGKVLVIGAGGVGTVVVNKMASLPKVFTEVLLASRTKSKCDAIAEISMKGKKESLNVSVACGIALFRILNV